MTSLKYSMTLLDADITPQGITQVQIPSQSASRLVP